MGIEPTPSAWKAEVLPLNYTRRWRPSADVGRSARSGRRARAIDRGSIDQADRPRRHIGAGGLAGTPTSPATLPTPRGSTSSQPPALQPRRDLDRARSQRRWWRGEDSNLRRLSRQIYSLIPLTAREPLQTIELGSVSRGQTPVNRRSKEKPGGSGTQHVRHRQHRRQGACPPGGAAPFGGRRCFDKSRRARCGDGFFKSAQCIEPGRRETGDAGMLKLWACPHSSPCAFRSHPHRYVSRWTSRYSVADTSAL